MMRPRIPAHSCINKIDLAPLVGASLEVMDRDARRMWGEKPFIFAGTRHVMVESKGLAQVTPEESYGKPSHLST